MSSSAHNARDDRFNYAREAHERSGEFWVDIEPNRDRVLVRPVGEVDIATAEQLEQPIVDLMERGFQRVVVDLGGVTFLDSTGVHALIRCNERASELATRMSIILGGPATRRVLQITGIIDHFEIEPPRSNGRIVADR